VTANPLIGTWKLVSWENRGAEGQLSYPLGRDARGYLTYTLDGYMFVAIMRDNRANFVSDDLLGGTTEEKAQASESHVSYCGRYEYQRDKVIHHVEVSSFPNWVGVAQERLAELEGNRLTLSTHAILLEGRQQTAHLVWERVKGFT